MVRSSALFGSLSALAILLASAVPSAQAATSLGSLTLTEVKARIFTPNGDGYNDKARFEFDNPELLPVSGTVYDIHGARVADLVGATASPYEALLWDGKDDGGQTVPGGIYIYQIEYQGEKATGTVVVSR